MTERRMESAGNMGGWLHKSNDVGTSNK
jgi:hypothetical protein